LGRRYRDGDRACRPSARGDRRARAWQLDALTVASDRPYLVRALVLLAGPAGKVPKGVDAVPIPAEVRAQIKRCEDTSLPDACAYTRCSSRPATTLSLGCWAGTLN